MGGGGCRYRGSMPAKAMRRPDLSLVLDSIRNKRQRIGVAGELARIFPGEHLRAAVREVEHHLAPYGEPRFMGEPRNPGAS